MGRGTRRLLGGFVAATAAAVVLVACGSSEGTVVAKTDQAVYDYGCRAGGTMTGPVAAPAWGSCAEPRCWRLVVRDSEGGTSEPCVNREEYDRTPLGAFWHGRTDG
jgi:hypothetical protein